MNLLEIKKITKKYPGFQLKNVSFNLEEGYIMGFIGRNGAGKTTTLKSILHFIKPDSGKAFICGYDVDTNEMDVKNSIGFVSGTECFYSSKKIKDITNVVKKFYKNWNEELYKNLLIKFNIDENKKPKELSCGMKIKYQIALAMCHDAKLLILDEPTSGLDPVSRDELVLLFQKYISDGKHSILFSTHITSDLEKCADYITYIHDGEIIHSCDSFSFKEKYLLVSGDEDKLTDELKEKVIGLNIHKLYFEGMIKIDDKDLFTSTNNNFEISNPSIEEIMVHFERKNQEVF